jgi:hypothetical protein
MRNLIAMARIRTIQPGFARSPSMGRVSREARLLFVLLWTVVDDEGRCHAAPEDLASALYPSDFDAARYLHGWLDELKGEGCVECYEVDDLDYLRIVHWHRHQWINHPTKSYLPPAPHERLRDSGIPETSGTLRGRRHKRHPVQKLGGRSGTFPEFPEENPEDDEPITPQSVVRDLRRIRRNAEADRSHASAIRSVEVMARIGLASGKNDRNDGGELLGPSPPELHGLPDTR